MSHLATFVSAHLGVRTVTTVPFDCRRATVPYATIDQTYSSDERAGDFTRGAEEIAARMDRLLAVEAGQKP